MKTIRLTLLYSLGLVALFCIFSEPADDSPSWFTDLALSKLLGLAALGAAWGIHHYWPQAQGTIRKTKCNTANEVCR